MKRKWYLTEQQYSHCTMKQRWIVWIEIIGFVLLVENLRMTVSALLLVIFMARLNDHKEKLT